MTQGIGLRPQPWALFCRPVGPVRFSVGFSGIQLDNANAPNTIIIP
jgi:hypothetical protein